jgi:hypothetical protein
MKYRIISGVSLVLLLSVISTADAHTDVRIGINPFGFGVYAPPPVVYQPDPYYVSPPVVYFGGGNWGDHRGRHSDGHRGGGRRR